MRHYLPRKNTDPALPGLCSQSHCQEGGGRWRKVIRMFKHILVSRKGGGGGKIKF